eukprot:TRINITY_DN8185_c0_g1_i1.p1 TRINITY_DN8185_c0_g1~~TRINITY_DN8185_c0_g1_i1.p1  ORF type:complete len:281 (+),score=51.30 TRINITY_DN8185_c0_g1_i1:162-1004(+)
MEAFHYPMAQILYDSLDIQKAENVIEVGTGGGYNLRQFLIQKPSSCHWVATDISDVMLAISESRIEEFLKNPFVKVEQNYVIEEPPKYEDKDIKELNLSYRKVDSRDLSQFQSNSFDRYYANQVIGHKSGRDQILKEAFRVLKPGGLLGITAFGRKENCKYATILKETALEQGMDAGMFPPSDPFELAKKELLISELEKTGFEIKTSFYVCFPIFEAELLWGVQLKHKTFLKGQFEKADQDMFDKILVAVKKKYQQMLESTKSPVTMEALYIIATKKEEK